MTDLALQFDPAAEAFDLALLDGTLAGDDGLRTALIISLFTDARARADDPVPQVGGDPRGWWGDVGSDDPNDRIGSRLWLLAREKLTGAVALKARDIVREALAWLVADGIVRAIEIEVTMLRPTVAYPTGALGIGVELTRPDGPARQRFDFVWTATARSIAA